MGNTSGEVRIASAKHWGKGHEQKEGNDKQLPPSSNPFSGSSSQAQIEQDLKEAAKVPSVIANQKLRTESGAIVDGMVVSTANGKSQQLFVRGQEKPLAIREGYLVHPDGTRDRIVGRDSNDPFFVDSKAGTGRGKPFIDPQPTGEFKAIASAPSAASASSKSITTYEAPERAQQPKVGVAMLQQQSNAVTVEHRTSDAVRDGGRGIARGEMPVLPEQLRGGTVLPDLGNPVAKAGAAPVRVQLGDGVQKVVNPIDGAKVSANVVGEVKENCAQRPVVGEEKSVVGVREAAKVSADQLVQLVRDRGGMPGREAESMVADARGSKEFLMKSATPASGNSGVSPLVRGGEADVAARQDVAAKVKVGAERFVQVPEKMVAVREDMVRGERRGDKVVSTDGGRRGSAVPTTRSVGEDIRGGVRNEAGAKVPQNGGTSMDVSAANERRIGKIQDATKSGDKVAPKLDIALAVKLAEPKVKERVVEGLARVEKVVREGGDGDKLGLGAGGRRVVAIAKELGAEKVAALKDAIVKSENGKPPKFDRFDAATMEGYRKMLQILVAQASVKEAAAPKGVGKTAAETVRAVGDTVKAAVESVRAVVQETREAKDSRQNTKESKETVDQKVRDSEGLTMAERRLAFVMGLLSGIGFGARKEKEEKPKQAAEKPQQLASEKNIEDECNPPRRVDDVQTLRTDRTLRNELKDWKGFWSTDDSVATRDSAYRAIYVVRKGDTVRSIALKHPMLGNVRLWELIVQVNELSTSTDAEGRTGVVLRVGEHILIPSHDDVVIFWAEKWLIDRKEERKAARVCCLQCRKAVPGGNLRCGTCNWSNEDLHIVDTVLDVMEPKVVRKWIRE